MQFDSADAHHQTQRSRPDGVGCPGCQAALWPGMRFCRQCGYRLGEGIEDYAETRRFDGLRPTAPTVPHLSSTFGVGAAGLQGTSAPAATKVTSHRGSDEFRSSQLWKKKCQPGRRRWMWWMILIFVMMAASGGIAKLARGVRVNGAPPFSASVSRSYVGAHIEDGHGGALLEAVELPGSPADRAGLVGGDVMTSFDGQPVTDEDDLMELLKATPAGKMVQVIYRRDGAEHMTTLTPISKDERARLAQAFHDRPEGKGYVGLESGELKRVSMPEQKIYGVRLGGIKKNHPGYMAGLRQGDVVIELEQVPIRTERELLARIERALPDSILRVVVIRDRVRLEIPLKMGVR